MTSSEAPNRPRPVRAGAGEPVEVRMTVNGTPVTVHVPARVTLADVLRDQLGLTGTHVGCEHGVCGMCTVLVDGEAARACLLFAVQLDQAEVVTVEGLGRPDELHPLQESFGRNHALQCGFCTPGFLMSSYDLLTHQPGVREQDLPQELSGVICRCTGYRNIVTAVREAQQAHPGGIPAPGNCARRALAGRGTGRSVVDEEPTGAPAEQSAAKAEIVLPEGEPTIAVDVATEVGVGQDQVWAVFDDVHRLARCLPGAELTEELGEDYYAGRARVSVGPIKLAFKGVAHIAEHDRAARRMRVLAQGRDTGGAQTQADILLRTEPAAEGGTRLHAEAKVYLTGRIAQFGRALAGDVSRHMFEQFAAAVSETATTGDAPQGRVKAPGAFRLLLRSLLGRLRRRSR
ncbi:2Fe-2S iron-sulfur cluster-binding protein [Amycolatopsis acidiphila]|uniref:2Fe-2S iron-sulfur cluster binding domain-containing protein n=1 Tax=Amycolatopsis acidiphila TaxID=715473 RepID=A0A558A2Y9_9PSEU|nr:2Fe-2S iron-sulfur cluster-binding protein [Amycolatopsis acidiphila]TVT18619.1 2Fe-2S iron-sulfur cluster binding domain-containing protein [Amycolatopsis acidiphila]UIJ56600.1 2Fe-2S iron-sulfur cluster-binding protein [Amycolatopsis acidiphila]GHG66452.1 carbon monoxide dehydrogenase [Amycolatopsis acidiphila]